MRQTFLFCLMCTLSASSFASVLPEHWQRVGQAELKVLWFDIYHAELLTPNGEFQPADDDLLLRLTYQRDVRRAKLLKETAKELKRFADEPQIVKWLSELETFWPDVSRGDRLVFYITPEGQGHFFNNDEWLGVIKDPDFSQAFINIWLAEQSRFPKLAARLRGEVLNETME